VDSHIASVAQPSNKEKLLSEGLRVVHKSGFGASSVRDIVQAAGVPQGSFTNHFASKEAFGMEILARYIEATDAVVAATLRNDTLAPLQRLRGWIEGYIEYLKEDDCRMGCLLGNLSAEASEHSEVIRNRVARAFTEYQEAVAYCLRAAVAAGELVSTTDTHEIAGFIISSLQGSILIAKAQRNSAPIERFLRLLFSRVLQPVGAIRVPSRGRTPTMPASRRRSN
jgi:TetR/AcrR family transcriptional repressor of nem operon